MILVLHFILSTNETLLAMDRVFKPPTKLFSSNSVPNNHHSFDIWDSNFCVRISLPLFVHWVFSIVLDHAGFSTFLKVDFFSQCSRITALNSFLPCKLIKKFKLVLALVFNCVCLKSIFKTSKVMLHSSTKFKDTQFNYLSLISHQRNQKC